MQIANTKERVKLYLLISDVLATSTTRHPLVQLNRLDFAIFTLAHLPPQTQNRESIENGEIRWRARETGRRWHLQSLPTLQTFHFIISTSANIYAEFIVVSNRWRRSAKLWHRHVAITGINLVAQVSLLTICQQSDGELLSLVFLTRRDSHPPDAPRILFVVCCSVVPQYRNLSSIVLKHQP